MRTRELKASIIFLALFSAFSLSGCGKDAGVPNSSQTNSQNAPTPLPAELPSEDPNPIPSPSPTPTNLVQTLSITTLGVQAFLTQAETGSALKLTLSPKPNDNSDYGCVSYRVEIGGNTFHTGILRVEEIDSGNCSASPTSAEIDYSSYLAAGAANALDIQIRVEQTDRSCYLMGFRCPSWTPQATDSMHGELTLEINQPN